MTLEAYLDQTYKRGNRPVDEFALEMLQTERANVAHWSNLLSLQLAANGMAQAVAYLESNAAWFRQVVERLEKAQ